MKVTDPNAIVCSSGLLSVQEIDGGVRITLKNKNTLDITPELDEEGKFVGFAYNHISGSQNRKINSLKEKMARMQAEIQNLVDTDLSADDEDEEELEEEIEDIVEDEE